MAQTPSPLEKSNYKLKRINLQYLIAIRLVPLVLRQLKLSPPKLYDNKVYQVL